MLLICLRIKVSLAAEYFQVRIKQTEKQVRELEKEWRKEMLLHSNQNVVPVCSFVCDVIFGGQCRRYRQ